jgi:hypothetical protein
MSRLALAALVFIGLCFFAAEANVLRRAYLADLPLSQWPMLQV